MLATAWLDVLFVPLYIAGIERIEPAPGTGGDVRARFARSRRLGPGSLVEPDGDEELAATARDVRHDGRPVASPEREEIARRRDHAEEQPLPTDLSDALLRDGPRARRRRTDGMPADRGLEEERGEVVGSRPFAAVLGVDEVRRAVFDEGVVLDAVVMQQADGCD